MIIYQRNIYNKLFSLRISFFILIAACIYAFTHQYQNIGYVLAILFLTLSIVAVKNLIVYPTSFQIKKYYFFGWIKKTWHFNKKDNLNITTYGSNFGETGDTPNSVQDDNGIGCLFMIFSFFLPYKISIKEYKIEKLDELNDVIKVVRLLITKTEFNYLNKFISQ